MKKTALFLVAAFLISTAAIADVTPHAAFTTPSNIVVTFTIPEGYKVYAESITTSATIKETDDEVALTAIRPPKPVEQNVAGQMDMVYASDVTFAYVLPDTFTNAHVVTVGWQACTETACFMPEKKQFYAFESKEAEPKPIEAETKGVEANTSNPDRVLAAYADAQTFLTFLSPENGAQVEKQNLLERARERGGLFLLIAVVILGGVLLNLTPCILPLIPVNLAILGMGTHAASRRQGIIIGSSFGLGITIAFGSLAIISAITGAVFGTLQSSPIFNAVFAIIFCVLALAMLDVFTIDFTRFGPKKQRKTHDNKKPTNLAMRLAGAFVAGAGSALLAGACVAPVLIATLAQSALLISDGQYLVGGSLPFFLGLGMGLPWVFFGGGIGALPRPGKWMKTVKIGFAIVFLIFAGFYAHTAWRILSPTEKSQTTSSDIAWLSSEAELAGIITADPKPVLIYLTADWCGACRKMASSTFQDPAVQEALESYHAVMIDCTVFDDPDVKAIVKRLGAPGLPFFAIFDATAD